MPHGKYKIRLGDRIAAALDIPADVLPGNIGFELTNGNDISVIGCKAIEEYSAERVVFRGRRQTLTVTGSDFELYTYADGKISAKGFIENVKISRSGDK